MKSWKYLIHHLFKRQHTFSINEQRLKKKLPDWAEKQIEEELAFFKRGFSAEDIKETAKNEFLFHFKIHNNSLTLLNPAKYPRLLKFVSFMRRALETYTFPNMEFIFTVHDLYEDKIHSSPVFAISKKASNRRVLLLPHVEWMGYNDILLKKIRKKAVPWEKKEEKLFWRGASSGLDIGANPRLFLAELSQQNPLLIDAAISQYCQTCKAKYPPKKWLPPEKQLKYKYLAAVDGNCFPGSFFWQLFSKSLTFKNNSDFLEWYYKGLKPDEHYISYGSDLIQKIEEMKNRDGLAKEIAENASSFAEENLSNENIINYIHKLFIAYSETGRFT